MSNENKVSLSYEYDGNSFTFDTEAQLEMFEKLSKVATGGFFSEKGWEFTFDTTDNAGDED